MQHISNKIDGGKYTGETEAIYYQSEKEILGILEWMDGTPKKRAYMGTMGKTMLSAFKLILGIL